MNFSIIIGSLGVAILLMAFIMVLFKWLRADGWLYSLLNLAGALLAGYASLLIDYIPFVVLEGAWATVAGAGLVRAMWKGRERSTQEDKR